MDIYSLIAIIVNPISDKVQTNQKVIYFDGDTLLCGTVTIFVYITAFWRYNDVSAVFWYINTDFITWSGLEITSSSCLKEMVISAFTAPPASYNSTKSSPSPPPPAPHRALHLLWLWFDLYRWHVWLHPLLLLLHWVWRHFLPLLLSCFFLFLLLQWLRPGHRLLLLHLLFGCGWWWRWRWLFWCLFGQAPLLLLLLRSWLALWRRRRRWEEWRLEEELLGDKLKGGGEWVREEAS